MERALTSSLEIPGLWRRNTSPSCLSIRYTGFKEVMGSWKIMEISEPRIFLASFLLKFVTSRPFNTMESALNSAVSGRSLINDREVIVFPHPDSPTNARVFPSSMKKETPSTDFTIPSGV